MCVFLGGEGGGIDVFCENISKYFSLTQFGGLGRKGGVLEMSRFVMFRLVAHIVISEI